MQTLLHFLHLLCKSSCIFCLFNAIPSAFPAPVMQVLLHFLYLSCKSFCIFCLCHASPSTFSASVMQTLLHFLHLLCKILTHFLLLSCKCLRSKYVGYRILVPYPFLRLILQIFFTGFRDMVIFPRFPKHFLLIGCHQPLCLQSVKQRI